MDLNKIMSINEKKKKKQEQERQIRNEDVIKEYRIRKKGK